MWIKRRDQHDAWDTETRNRSTRTPQAGSATTWAIDPGGDRGNRVAVDSTVGQILLEGKLVRRTLTGMSSSWGSRPTRLSILCGWILDVSLDVDTGSYLIGKRFVKEGYLPDPTRSEPRNT